MSLDCCDDATVPDRSPVFALGLGCQKGGTSWLHDYLAASPACDPGFRKEYHVFDGLDLPSEAWMRRRVVARAAKAVEALERGVPANVDALRQAAFYADPTTYFDYFTSLLARPGVSLTCDITPSYALLPATRLVSIRAGFAERGVPIVPVFLLRDPVERIWSMVRMNQQRRPEDFPGPTSDWVRRLYAQDDHALRTRYDLTLTALDEAFGPGASWLALYEQLFDRDVLAVAVRPARHRLPRARPEPRRQRLAQGRGPPGRPGRRDGRVLPGRLRRHRPPLPRRRPRHRLAERSPPLRSLGRA